jgi:predicted MFS family arabinose efflux permease
LSLSRTTGPHITAAAGNWTTVFQLPGVLRAPAAAAALFGVGFGAFFQFLPLLAERRAIPATGSAYAVYGIAVIVTRLITGRWQDRRDRRFLLWPAFFACAAGLGLLGVANSAVVMLVGTGLVAVAGGIIHPGLMAIHAELVSETLRGRALAAFYLAFDLGIGLGTWMLAPALQRFGLQGLYLSAAVLTACGMVPVSWLSASFFVERKPVLSLKQ